MLKKGKERVLPQAGICVIDGTMKTMLKNDSSILPWKSSEYFFSHPSQRLYSIQLKLKVAISENIPCHLSNYFSIKCNQRWPLRNQWIIKGKKVLV